MGRMGEKLAHGADATWAGLGHGFRFNPGIDGTSMNRSATAPLIRPALLMTCGCVPHPDGPTRQREAWRLLQAARRSHRVYLAAIADGPVNLLDWRRLGGVADAHALLPGTGRRGLRRALRQALAPWQARASFDLVLCDAKTLWPVAAGVEARLHLDTRDPSTAMQTLHAVAAPVAPPTRMAA